MPLCKVKCRSGRMKNKAGALLSVPCLPNSNTVKTWYLLKAQNNGFSQCTGLPGSTKEKSHTHSLKA